MSFFFRNFCVVSNNKTNSILFLPFPLFVQWAQLLNLHAQLPLSQAQDSTVPKYSCFSGSQSSQGQHLASTFRSCRILLASWDLPPLDVSFLPVVSDPSLSLFPSDFCLLFFDNLGAALSSSLSRWDPFLLKGSICWSLWSSLNPYTSSSLSLFLKLLSNFPQRLRLTVVAGCRLSPPSVGFSLLQFYLKTCSQQFPFRMETSPTSEYLLWIREPGLSAFLFSSATPSSHFMVAIAQVCELSIILTSTSVM